MMQKTSDLDFIEDWNSLTKEQKQMVKEIVIERIKQIPDKLEFSIG